MATEFTKVHWVRIQKRLRKKKTTVGNGYFTKEMLDNRRSVFVTTTGILPDSKRGIEFANVGISTEETPIPLNQGY
jgi:hypothetical protein